MAPSKKDAGYSIIFPRRKAGQASRGPTQPVIVTMDLLKELAHMPLATAADKLGVSPTAIKKACRKLGVHRWPIKLPTESTRPGSSPAAQFSAPVTATAPASKANRSAVASFPSAAEAASTPGRGRPAAGGGRAKGGSKSQARTAESTWAPKSSKEPLLQHRQAVEGLHALSQHSMAVSGEAMRNKNVAPIGIPFNNPNIQFVPHRSLGQMQPGAPLGQVRPGAAETQHHLHPAAEAWVLPSGKGDLQEPLNGRAQVGVAPQQQHQGLPQGVAEPRFWQFAPFPAQAAAGGAADQQGSAPQGVPPGGGMPAAMLLPSMFQAKPFWHLPGHDVLQHQHQHQHQHHQQQQPPYHPSHSSASSASSTSTTLGGAKETPSTVQTLSRGNSSSSFNSCPDFGTITPQLSRGNSLSNFMPQFGRQDTINSATGQFDPVRDGSLALMHEGGGSAWNLSYLASLPNIMADLGSRPSSRPLSRMSSFGASGQSDSDASTLPADSAPDAAEWMTQALSRSLATHMQTVSA